MSERKIVLTMAEPDPEAAQFIRIGASEHTLYVATSGAFESTGEAAAFLREVADELENDACGQDVPYAGAVPPGQVRGGEVAVGGSDG